MHDDLTRHLGNEALWLVMYKIRYFLMLKYFMKYFGNISVFTEIIFQNAMPFCTSCFVSAPWGHGTKFNDVKCMQLFVTC